MERLVEDLHFAWRSLSRDRPFTLIAVSTLTVGIAATVTSFAVTKSVLLDPLPVPDPYRAVMVWEQAPSGRASRNVTSADSPRAASAQLYGPLVIDPAAPPGGRNLITVARMKPGVTLAAAESEMRRVVADE